MNVWNYSPRQMVAFWMLKQKRERRQHAMQIRVAMLGARGDKESLKKALAELEKD